MDKNVMISPDGKNKITVFDSEVENLKANGWTLEGESIKKKSKKRINNGSIYRKSWCCSNWF